MEAKIEIKKDKFPIKITIALFCYGVGILYFITNAVGIFFVPVSETLGISRGTFSTYYSVQALVAMFTLFFSGKIIQRHQDKIKLILIGSSIIIFIGYALFAIGTSLWFWYLGGALIGFGLAFCSHMVIGTLVNNWFKLKAGTMMGLITTWVSVVGIFLNPVLTSMIATKGYQSAYWFIGIGMLIFTVIPALFLIQFKPADAGRKAYGEEKAAELAKQQAESVSNPESIKSVSYAQALKSAPFWFIFIFTYAACCWANFIQIIPGYAASVGFTGAMIGVAMSAMMFGGIAGKLALGFLSDRFGAVKATGITVVIGIMGILLMIMSDSTSPVMFNAGSVLFGVGFGILGVVPPIVTREAFGMKDYASIYGNITTAIWIGTATIIPIYNFVFDRTASYVFSMYLSIGILIAGFILLIAAMKMAKKLPREV